ncbi:MAG: regulator of amino acid metabolism, contains ACT domain protein [Methanomassiliicoccaceae archaeon]|nr:regulator of amino acid metabolism, contains ACT domain protein [Methanomassiliicoccaceae archaeon]
MDLVKEGFGKYPSQEKVARLLLKQGIRVEKGIAFCNSIEQSDAAIARAAGVDRRVVRSTLDRISSVPELDRVFSKLQSMSLLANVASEIGCTALEIIPTDATIPGIVAGITDVIYRAGLSVRQAVVDDPGVRMDSHLIIVVDGVVPPELLPAIKQSRGVHSVILR